MKKEKIMELIKLNKDYLLNNCVKYWAEYSPDYKNGGYYTCLDRQWNVYNTDKSVWFQGRGAWLFSRLYNQVEKKQEWLDIARLGVEFINKHCFDTDGRMYFQVTEDGRPLRKRRYVFSETFAIIALAEYAKASGDMLYLEKAKSIYKMVVDLYKSPKGIEPKVCLETRRTLSLSLPMILLATSQNLREIDYDSMYDSLIDEILESLFKYFYKPEEKALFETVGENGERLDSPQGRCLNPGHAIETAWFLMHEGLYRQDGRIIDKALNILNWSIEHGWDKEYGGLLYFVDIEGKPAEQLEWDMKLWWPHTEALYALLLAHHITGEEKYELWYDKMLAYSFEHFADKEYGEWFGYLHRDGSVSNTMKGSMWKGHFHLPRALLLCVKLLERMEKGEVPVSKIL